MPTRARSTRLPVILAITTAALAVALLVGWTLLTTGTRPKIWILVLGVIAFGAILAIIGLLVFILVREVRRLREQDQFIDSITHELKTPLASLRLAIETLERPGLEETQRAPIEAMMRGDVVRLSGLIDDVLAASRLAAGRAGHALSEVPVEDVVHRATDTVLERHGLEPGAIVVELASGLRARTDAAALELVLRNLLDNAIKYSRSEHRRAWLQAAPDAKGRRLKIVVRDEGIGLTKRELRRAFGRFQRGEREAVRARPGTGLGLWVVAETVRRLGGRIEARSEGEGKGSRFEVTLPRAAS